MTVDDVFAGLLAFEAFALASRRTPTVTALCRKRRALAVAVAALIFAHLIVPEGAQ